MRRAVSGVLVLAMAGLAGAADSDRPSALVLKVGRIHTMTGDPIEEGTVVVRDGRIDAVGRDLETPAGAEVLEWRQGVLTPGLIDACCVLDFELTVAAQTAASGTADTSLWEWIATQAAHQHDEECSPLCGGPPLEMDEAAFAASVMPWVTSADQASEVVPHRAVIDSVNWFSNDFRRLVDGGVTTVYVSPDSTAVIGERGAVIKTGGPQSDRVVRRADAVKVTLGSDPSYRGIGNDLPPTYGPPPSFHTRRPTTRMGVDWVFRKAFYDARRARQGLPLHGADVPPAQAIPVLQDLLDGAVPLRIQARMQHDIFSALRLAQEFGLRFVLEEGTEAYRCLPQLATGRVPVILGPVFMTPSGWRARTAEVRRPRLNSAQQLADAGIEFALTAQELRDEEGLVRQAMVASQNGLSAAAALRAVTQTPARLLGLENELGVIAAGARADLVVWSAEPLEATSRPLLVLINGHIVSKP